MRIKLDHQRIWFASDYHFCHANVIKYDNRPYKDVDEMNQALIDNWNHYIAEDDVVFYLGDLSFDKNGKQTYELVHQLKGKIHSITGNHDKEKDLRKLNRFESVSDYISLSVLDEDNPRKWQEIMMMHFPILSWDKAHHGAWHLHGHCHGSLMNDSFYDWYYKQKVIDVGCVMTEYHPLHYSDVKQIMSTKEVQKVGHH